MFANEIQIFIEWSSLVPVVIGAASTIQTLVFKFTIYLESVRFSISILANTTQGLCNRLFRWVQSVPESLLELFSKVVRNFLALVYQVDHRVTPPGSVQVDQMCQVILFSFFLFCNSKRTGVAMPMQTRQTNWPHAVHIIHIVQYH